MRTRKKPRNQGTAMVGQRAWGDPGLQGSVLWPAWPCLLALACLGRVNI